MDSKGEIALKPISRIIAVWLSALILITGIIVGMLYSYVLVNRNRNEYIKDCNVRADLIASELAVGLWTYNYVTIKHISHTAISSTPIQALQIVEDIGKKVLSIGESSNPDYLLLKRTIAYQGKNIGRIDIAFARFDPIPIWLHMMTTTVAILLPVLIASILLSFFILKRFLSDPLKGLLRSIEFISDGKYQKIFVAVGGLEITRIADSVKRLAIKLDHREIKLKESLEKIQQLNETLEQRIAERTVELENRAELLQQLALELSGAEDRERRHIASILHDDFQQQLAYIKMELDLVCKNADTKLGQKLGLLAQFIGECIEKSRNLSYELNPPTLHRSGLLAALDVLAKDMEKKQGFVVTVQKQKSAEPTSLSLASILYRSARELLINVVRHAGVESALLDIRNENGLICLKVEDCGNGFDFEAVRAGQGSETGFGIYSIEDRMTSLGGSMKVVTQPGKGCCVVLTVPKDVSRKDTLAEAPFESIVQESVRDMPAEPIYPMVDGEQIRVLLADDHKMMREALANLLQGHKSLTIVGQAVNGHEAVKQAAQLKPDVILMDVTMPELNGFEATAQITRENPDIRIIGLSMHNESDTHQKMFDAGVSAYLTKTDASDILVETILRVYRGTK